jgi:hypothetical protein
MATILTTLYIPTRLDGCKFVFFASTGTRTWKYITSNTRCARVPVVHAAGADVGAPLLWWEALLMTCQLETDSLGTWPVTDI